MATEMVLCAVVCLLVTTHLQPTLQFMNYVTFISARARFQTNSTSSTPCSRATTEPEITQKQTHHGRGKGFKIQMRHSSFIYFILGVIIAIIVMAVPVRKLIDISDVDGMVVITFCPDGDTCEKGEK